MDSAVGAAERLSWAAHSTLLASKDGGGEAQPDEHAVSEWALGIFLCLAGAAATNLGLTLQKRSFLTNDAQSPGKQKAATAQPLWLSGLAVFIVGQVLNLLAFGYTSQAVAATLGSFSLVTNGVFAPLLLRERLTRTIVVSIGVIVAGSVVVVLASSRVPQEYTLSELLHLLERPLFVFYLSFLIISLVISIFLMWREDQKWDAQQRAAEEWEETEESGKTMRYSEGEEQQQQQQQQQQDSTEPAGLQLDPEMSTRGATFTFRSDSKDASAASAARRFKEAGAKATNNNAGDSEEKPVKTWHDHQPASEQSALLGVKVHSSPPPVAASSPTSSTSSSSSSSSPESPGRPAPPSPLTPILAGAILSSMSVLFGKCSIQLLKETIVKGENQFVHPLAWALTAVFLTCAVSAVAFLNIGLRRGAALFVVPLYYVLNTLLAIIGGLVYFEEFKRFAPVQGMAFAIGVGMTVAGVYISSRGQAQGEEGEEDSESEGEGEGEEEEAEAAEAAAAEEEEEGVDLETPNPVEALLDEEVQQEAEEKALEERDRELREKISFPPPPAAAATAATVAAGLVSGSETEETPSPAPGPLTSPEAKTSSQRMRKPSSSALKQDHPATDALLAQGRPPRKLSVRFGMEELGPAQGVVAPPPSSAAGSATVPPPRMSRTQSEPGFVPTEAEMAAARRVSERTALRSSTLAQSAAAAAAAHQNALSTPQPRGSHRMLSSYGSVEGQGRSFRTPPTSSSKGAVRTKSDAASDSSDPGYQRARSMSSLPTAAHSQTRLRDQQLKAVSWRRAAAASSAAPPHSKRFSLDHNAYQSSFGALFSAAAMAAGAGVGAIGAGGADADTEYHLRQQQLHQQHGKHKLERRHSMANVGIGHTEP